VPIRGEAGLGYVLDRDFDMPPLMLTPNEIEAAVFGAQWVAERGDPVLAGAARDLIAKIAAAVPEHLRCFIAEPSIGPPPATRWPLTASISRRLAYGYAVAVKYESGIETKRCRRASALSDPSSSVIPRPCFC
jgi:predicted DNA-binding transcriptional regulator YafY